MINTEVVISSKVLGGFFLADGLCKYAYTCIDTLELRAFEWIISENFGDKNVES